MGNKYSYCRNTVFLRLVDDTEFPNKKVES